MPPITTMVASKTRSGGQPFLDHGRSITTALLTGAAGERIALVRKRSSASFSNFSAR